MRRFNPFLLTLPTILVLLFISIYPLIYSLSLSFYYYILTKPTQIEFIGLENYVSVLSSYSFHTALRNTLVFTITVVTVEFLLGLGLALLLSEDFKGHSVVTSSLLFPLMISPVAAGITLRFAFHPQLGIVNYLLSLVGIAAVVWLGNAFNAMLAVMVTDIWQWTPFMFAILLAGIYSLPKEPYEAAQIDGASYWQVTRLITIPLLKPLILVALLLRSIDAFRVFDSIYVITGGGPGFATETLSMLVYRMGFRSLEIGIASATSYIIIFFLLTPYVILITRFFRGK